MGSLSLPTSGSVYVDAQILIYTVEKHATYLPRLRLLWDAFARGNLEIVTSELVLLETLVLPIRLNDVALQADYEHLLAGSGIRLIGISARVLRDAAALRAVHRSLKTPDAIHAATARAENAALILTNDSELRKILGDNAVALDDIVA